MAADHQLLDAPEAQAKPIAEPRVSDEELARLLKLAAAGHKGIDLGELSDDDLEAWVRRH